MAAENQLIMLESEISRELEVITDQLRQKYVLFVPLPAHQWSEVHRRFKYLVQNVEDRLKVAEKMLSDVEKEHDPKHERFQVSVLRTRLDDVETCKALIGRLTEVEGNLVQLTNGCGSLLESARLIISCKQILADVNRTADISELVGRASGLMSRELATHAGIVRAHLADFLRSSVVFELGVLAARQDGPKKATGTPSVNTLRINFGLPSDATTNLSALALLGDAEARLTKWAEQLVAGFVEPLLAHDDVKGFQREVNIIKSTEKTYTLRVKPAPGRENVCPTTVTDPATIAATFKTLVEMFTYLKSDLGEISVAGVSLVAALGEKLENPIKQLLLKHILLPISSDETKLSDMLKSTEAFRGELVKLGWWAPGGEAMKAFAESHASSFVDRKCLGIITRGRELVCKNYIELATVGADVKDGDETVDEFREAFLLRPGADPSDDDAYPQLMRLLKCSVSKSTVDFVDLLMSTLREAAETENEMLGARLGQTATNLVRLFVVLAPKHHKEAISTVPQIAAVFYNNCYYLAHRLLVLPFDIFNSPRAKEKNVELLRPAFICLVPELREEAARALERVLVQCRRQISAILTDDSLFVGLDDSSRLQKCDKTLNGCVKQLQTLASVWREVLTETVFCRALGNVASYFLAQLNELVLSKEDTRASDADATALQLERMLDQLKPLFEIRGHTMIHKFCEHAFFRTKELVLCLNGSLQTVDDRWCDGKGPLAQWLTPKEIRGLVRSLFANTEARKRVLERI